LVRRRGLERERIDEDGLATQELDVEGARVTEGEPGRRRALLYVKGEQCRVPQLGEAPLPRVGDQLHALGLDHCGRVLVPGQFDGGRLMVDQQPIPGQLLAEGGLLEGVPLLGEGLVDLSQEPAVTLEDEAGWVAKGGRDAASVRSWCSTRRLRLPHGSVRGRGCGLDA